MPEELGYYLHRETSSCPTSMLFVAWRDISKGHRVSTQNLRRLDYVYIFVVTWQLSQRPRS